MRFRPAYQFLAEFTCDFRLQLCLIFFELTILAYGQLENLSVLRLVLVDVRFYFYFFFS